MFAPTRDVVAFIVNSSNAPGVNRQSARPINRRLMFDAEASRALSER